MTKHTPGPWRYEPWRGDGRFICADTPKGQVELATVHSQSEYVARLPELANARLMAAAPKLLEAVVALRDRLIEAGGEDVDADVLLIAKTAIAEATGE